MTDEGGNAASPWSALTRRKLVQWAFAYAAGAWVLLQVLSLLAGAFHWPDAAMRIGVGVAVTGFLVTLILSWYHGERGAQRIARAEVLFIAVCLLLGTALTAWLANSAVDAQFPAHPAAPAGKRSEEQAAASASRQEDSAAIPHAIAVLPFVNLSSDKENEYFADGLSEELLNLLAQTPQLRVIARTSSFSFKGKEVPIATIAQELGVPTLLEGSVRRAGTRLRVTAQLIRAADSSHLWSQTYERELTDVFVVQDEIAAAVVSALKVKLLPDQAAPVGRSRSQNIEAYSQFLLGREYFNRGTPEGFGLAKAAYERAIELDPAYGAAYAGLAIANTNALPDTVDSGTQEQADRRNLDLAERAIALAPDLSDGYVARAAFRFNRLWQWQDARADLEHARALDPANTEAYRRYAQLMAILGRTDDSIEALKQAIEVDPLNSAAYWALAMQYLSAGDLMGARATSRRGLEISPDSHNAHFYEAFVDLAEHKPDDARAHFERTGPMLSLVGRAVVEHELGNAAASQQALEELKRVAPEAYYYIGQIYAWRGERDQAFAWLDRAFEHRTEGLDRFRYEPPYARLKDDPRYAAMLDRMGLPR